MAENDRASGRFEGETKSKLESMGSYLLAVDVAMKENRKHIRALETHIAKITTELDQTRQDLKAEIKSGRNTGIAGGSGGGILGSMLIRAAEKFL